MWESERRAFRQRAADVLATPVVSTAQLRAEGVSKRAIAAAIREGRLIRARRDNYLAAGTDPALVAAVEAGGVLSCVSALRLLGVFVLDGGGLHVLVPPHSTRLKPSADKRIVRHWLPSSDGHLPRRACAHPIDTLAHAVRCQPPRAAVASLDSSLHTGLIRPSDVTEVFALLPKRFATLVPLLDGRAESGPETLARLLIRGITRDVDLQVRIDGVGRVDLLVNGWLVIECDSEAHHLGSEAYRFDRTRDLALAERGYTVLRLTAADIMWRPERVASAVRGLLRSRRRV